MLVLVIADSIVGYLLAALVSTVVIVPLMQLVGLVDSYILTILAVVIPYLLVTLVLMGVSGVLSAGLASVHLDLVRGDGHLRIKKFFESFNSFVDNFLLGFMYLLNVALWSCLFIIPGIYVSFSYALIFHVKKDHPEYRWQQCFDESERLMEGNRWRLFKLYISFIGWELLGALAFFGLGSLWVTPYINTSVAVFYEEAKNSKNSNVVSFDTKAKSDVDPVVVDLHSKGFSLHREK